MEGVRRTHRKSTLG